MTKRFRRNLILIVLILFVIYWTAVNILVSAVLVPSFMEQLDAFQRIAEQSYAEQVQESELKQNSGARGLRSVLEKLLIPVMYDVSSRTDVKKVTFDRESVQSGVPKIS